MRSKKIVDTLTLQEGETLKHSFDNYVDMAISAVDWTIFCTYQLQPDFSEGVQKIIQLPSMQVGCTNMTGGIMFDYVAPEDSIVFSVMHTISKKACLDEMKLKTGMISVINDHKIYNFMCSSRVKIYDIVLRKDANPILMKKLEQAVNKYLIDDGQKIATLIEKLIAKYGDSTLLSRETSIRIENEIANAMLILLKEQKPQTARFTKAEKAAVSIKKQLFKHMDHKMTISSLSEKYDVSEKGLQNGFKSLYDITPNKFMRLLKLNLVHHELIKKDSKQITVEKVAQKWGFSHMGRFSNYYTTLFRENPSATLKRSLPLLDGMREICVERKEEML